MYLLFTIALFNISHKNEFQSSSLFQKWQWEKSTGGFTGNMEIIPSVKTVLELNKNHLYYIFSNGRETFRDSFSLEYTRKDTILHLHHFPGTNKLHLMESEQVKQQGNKLLLRDYLITESYTHEFFKAGYGGKSHSGIYAMLTILFHSNTSASLP